MLVLVLVAVITVVIAMIVLVSQIGSSVGRNGGLIGHCHHATVQLTRHTFCNLPESLQLVRALNSANRLFSRNRVSAVYPSTYPSLPLRGILGTSTQFHNSLHLVGYAVE